MDVNAPPAKVWIFAGEASGDLYAGRLAEALHLRAPQLHVAGMGGSHLRAAGAEILVDSSELGVVGVVEVLRHYPMFRRIFHELVARAERDRPELVVLIDYPGFNLRFAKQMHARGIPVLYYISPQVWAWGKHRVALMARILRRILVIFPFEVALWERAGLPCTFVGHPLVDILQEQAPAPDRDPNLVLLLPGSRRSEVDRLAAPLYRTAVALQRRRPDLHFALPAPSDRIAAHLRELLAPLQRREALPLEIHVGHTVSWMRRASAGIAASGTVTIQSAILGLPLVVVYRVNPLTYALGRWLVDVPYITMVNLVAGREVFEEYLQGQVQPDVLAPALERILPGGDRREDALAGMREAVAALDTDGDASANAARAILSELGIVPREAEA